MKTRIDGAVWLPEAECRRQAGLSRHLLAKAIEGGAIPVQTLTVGKRRFVLGVDWRRYLAALQGVNPGGK